MPDYMMAEIMQGHGQLGAKEIKISKGQQQINIDVSRWNNGLYIAVLRNNEKIIAKQKFMVLR